MIPASLQKLPKPSMTQGYRQNPMFCNPMCEGNNKDKTLVNILNPFQGPCLEGILISASVGPSLPGPDLFDSVICKKESDESESSESSES